jgi:L-ribulose-5-phosphate 3-epimerase
MTRKKSLINKRIGFMQGRLIPSEKKECIQYFPDKNWKKEILIAKKNNFSVMEWTVNFENIKKNPLFKNCQIDKLKSYLKKNKIKVKSITCDFFMQKPFFKNKKNYFIINILKKIINNGQSIGIKYFIIPLVDQASIENKKQENIIIKKMKKLKDTLRGDATILFEIDYNPSAIIEFLNKFQSPKFRINYDTGNSAGIGYNFNDEKQYFKYVKNIHIKDKKLNGTSVRLGKGDFNFKDLFIFLKKIKYKGNFILQTARSKLGKDQGELNMNREYISKLL